MIRIAVTVAARVLVDVDGRLRAALVRPRLPVLGRKAGRRRVRFELSKLRVHGNLRLRRADIEVQHSYFPLSLADSCRPFKVS